MTAPGRHVLYVQPNSEVGGSDIALARTIEAMAETGQRSSVVLPGDGPLVPRLRAAGAELHFLPMQQLRTLPSPAYQARYLGRFPGTVRRLAALMRQIGPDLVHGNSLYCLYGAFAARRARVPYLWHVREMAPRVPLLTRAYAGMLSALSDTVLAMTPPCLDPLYPRGWPAHAVTMPDALDGPAFRAGLDRGRLRRELGIAPGRPIVGAAARLDPWKGLPVFLEAAARVARARPDAVFVIAGGAPAGLEAHEAELHAQAAGLGLGPDRLHFLGWRYRLADMADVMAGFDLFCHTSIQPEPFGLVLIEAMAVETPVIATAAGGPLSIIEPGLSGLLTPPGDAGALEVAVLRLLNAPDLARRIGTAGRARQEDEFSVPRFRQRLSDIYDRTVAVAG